MFLAACNRCLNLAPLLSGLRKARLGGEEDICGARSRRVGGLAPSSSGPTP